MSLKIKALTKSPWVYHLCAGGSCNNCDIEILDLLTPRFDVERFGVLLVGSIRHADALLVTGAVTKKTAPLVKKLWEQAPKPCLVFAIGGCACSQGIFKGSYSISPVPLDEVIPVHAYIPGCPPKPESMIAGIVKALQSLVQK